MILLPHETERFYRIWWALLGYVNAQRHLIADLPAQPTPGSLQPVDAVKIRDALWTDDSLREDFIAANPAGLAVADLEMVASWKHRVAGKFFVVKHLKKYSVFLDDRSPSRAYGVLGLVSPIEQVVGPYLPILVEAVLLPFEDRIIYDSLLAPYRITFGGGIRANLKIALRDAQEREGIITSLTPHAEPATDEAQADARTRNAKVIGEFRKALYKSGLSPKMVEHHANNLQSFADDHLLAQAPPRLLLEMQTKDVGAYLNSLDPERAPSAYKSFKRYAKFLWDSARSNPDALLRLQDFLRYYSPLRGTAKE